MALPKPQGGYRPIAVGEVLRRLSGKCLMRLVRDDAQTYFWTGQVGVAVPGGAERAIHAVRAWTQRHQGSPHKILVKLDYSNAFNCVSRAAVLTSSAEHFPQLSRWATWCYQQPSRLQFGEHVLFSRAGVQQGDPLGPLLFSLALQPIIEEIRAGPVDLALQYLGGGVLAGDIAAVGAALQLVQRRAHHIGLALNLAKCQLVVAGPADAAALLAHLPSELVVTSDGTLKSLSNFDFLGAAIGDAAFVRSHTADRAAKAGDLLDSISELTDPQVGLRLLKSCAGYCRMQHSMRCNPPTAQATALDMFDGMVRRCFSELTGIDPSEAQWQQASRGLAQAGLGLRSTASHAAAAFLASLGSSLEGCCQLDPAFSPDIAKGSFDVAQALRSFNADIAASDQLPMDKALGLPQRELSQRIDTANWAHQLQTATLEQRALLHSESGVGARAFLLAVPSGKTRMEGALFVAELRARLGMQDATEDVWRPRCDGVLDKFSHHASVCVAGGVRTQRHHAIRDIVFRWADRGGLRPEKERAGLLLPQAPDDVHTIGGRPMSTFPP